MRLRRKPAPGRQRQLNSDLNSSPVTFSYTSRRKQTDDGVKTLDDTKPASKGKTRSWGQKAGLLIFLLAVLLSVINILSLSSHAKILPMTGTQNNVFLRDRSVYEAAANKILAGSVWNRNKLTIDANKLNQEMRRQFPELVAVNMSIPLLAHRPVIYVQPSQPAIILVSKNGVFLIATSGKALLKADAPNVFSQNNLPIVHDQSGVEIKLTDTALPMDDVSFIQVIAAQLKSKNLPIESTILPPESRELHLKLAGEAYIVKFNLMSRKPREQVGAFIATKLQLQKQNIKPSQYVDVRVAGRVYYK